MALQSGLAAQVGFVAESTYGTRVAPTRFVEFNSESIAERVERIETNALRTGTRVLRSDRWVANRKGAAGDITMDVMSKGMGLLFKFALGASATTTPSGGTTSRTHTSTLADPLGLSFTTQVGRPDVTGTVRPFDYLGCKVASWELSNALDGVLMYRMSIDAQDESTAQSLATASYATSMELLTYAGGTISIGGSATDVIAVSVAGSNSLKTDRYFIRSNTLKKEPLVNDYAAVSGSITSEFNDLTLYSRFVNGTVGAFVGTWNGSIIDGTIKSSVVVTCPAIRFDGGGPVVAGNGVLTQTLPFKVLDDGTNPPISIAYTTLDTTP